MSNKDKELEEVVQEVQTPVDPFARTEEAAKGFENIGKFYEEAYNKRQQARTKRQRRQEWSALGSALGELFRGIMGHYTSQKYDVPVAIGPSISPKTYAKVEKLIDEGVADRAQLDKLLGDLNKLRIKTNVEMAKARDNYDIAQQRHEESLQTRKEIADANRQAADERAKQDRETREQIAKIQAEAKKQKGSGKNEKSEKIDEYEWMMSMAPTASTRTSTVTGGNIVAPQTTTTNYPATSTERQAWYNQHKQSLKDAFTAWGLNNNSEADQLIFTQLYSYVGKKYKMDDREVEVTVDMIANRLKKPGVTAQGLLKILQKATPVKEN